jgi:aromatic ring-opening dioxygenase LigB subunit
MLNFSLLVPHPPAIIPGVSVSIRKFEKTINALLNTSLRLRQANIEVLIILSPHGEIRPDSFTIQVPPEPIFQANFAEFNAPNIQFTIPRERILTAKIIEAVNSAGLKIEPLKSDQLDFGAAVPLFYFKNALPKIEIVSLGVSLANLSQHYEFGKILRAVVSETQKRVAIIASGELAHRIFKNSPHGFSPLAKIWDEELIADLRNEKFEKILIRDSFEAEEVGECGLRPLATLLGSSENFTPEILSYESPGGIGVAVMIMNNAKSKIKKC